MPRADRDWSTLRTREWQPVGTNARLAAAAEDASANVVAATGTCGGSSSSGGGPSVFSGGLGARGGGATTSKGANGRAGRGTNGDSSWRIDKEIGGKRWGEKERSGTGRQLERWEAPGDCGEQGIEEGTLEELTNAKSMKGWNQFKVNAELFGVVSTYKSDLSQYTTPLDAAKLPAELRRRAERIEAEINRRPQLYDGAGSDEEAHPDQDEEELFASVGDGGWSHCGWDGTDWASEDWNGSGAEWGASSTSWGGGGDANGRTGGHSAGAEDGGAGAIMALIAPTPGEGTSGICGCRARVEPEVRGWWRARDMSGASVPAGAKDALICPFSHRVFGDLTELVAHWAAALPRADDIDSDTATLSRVATEQFTRAATDLSWAEMAAETGLGEVFSVDSPRSGSVWENVLLHVSRSTSQHGGSIAEKPVSNFVAAAVQMRCWRRDQKVEHREVLESIATGLALHVLSANPGKLPGETPLPVVTKADSRCGGGDAEVASNKHQTAVCH
mmetsp:Transcript_21159/g.59204  ORF Transcript_21159/g.59204 Transcript_21159/m.59204 type:complete len:503 (-) Transcript_21159:146-1654(-)